MTGARMHASAGEVADRLARFLRAPSALRAATIAVVLLAAAFLGPRATIVQVTLLYGGLTGLLLWRHPGLAVPALLLATAFVPVEIGTGTESSVNVAIVGVAGITALWVLSMLVERRLRWRRAEPNAAWVALVLVAGVSIVAGGALWNPWVLTKGSFTLVQLAQWAIFGLSACAFALGANLLRSRRELEAIVGVVFALGAVWFVGMALPGAAPLTGHMLLASVGFRTWLVALLAGMALFHVDLGMPRRVALFGLAVASVALAYRTSIDWQSGWIPPLVALGTIAAVRTGRGFTRLAMIAALPGLVLLVAFVFPTAARHESWSFDTRLIAWRGLFDLLEGRWVFGLGLAAYWHYWRGIVGTMSFLDPTTGYLHYTYDPKVNMHNNYMDVLGQMGILGTLALAWLIVALLRLVRRAYVREPHGFGQAYIAACAGGLSGMLFAGLLGDWFFPFVYNVGLKGFRDSCLGWIILGGIVLLDHTREARAATPEEGCD